MDTFRKYKWLAAVVGVLLASIPVLWFISWLPKQGEAEVSVAAHWSIRMVEVIIDDAVAAFSELDRQGVRSCALPDVERLRKTLFASGTLSELALVNQNGQILCTDHGSNFSPRKNIVTAATPNSEIMLDVVRITDTGDRVLQVRRLAGSGKPSVAAMLRSTQMLPRIASEGAAFAGYARLALADGTLVGTSGAEPTESDPRNDQIISRTKSERYGPIVSVAMVRNGIIANYNDLHRIGMVVTGTTALLILICALVMPWRRHNPISDIEEALTANEFVPYYQPVIDINSGKLLGAEVLVRWRKSDGSIISPTGFISLLESNELVLDLTRALMRQVCKDIGPTIASRSQLYLAFNIAPRHFRDSAIISDLCSIFEDSPIQFSQIVLELTERDEIQDCNATRRVIAELHALGCRIALDDVGTGHNGLSYVLKLGVDIIKIDKMFVDAIATDPQSQAIMAMLADLARDLHMTIVAEGVEHFEQVMYLREHGIDAAQGYVFAPPLPGSAFIKLIEAIDPRPVTRTVETVGETLPNVVAFQRIQRASY